MVIRMIMPQWSDTPVACCGVFDLLPDILFYELCKRIFWHKREYFDDIDRG